MSSLKTGAAVSIVTGRSNSNLGRDGTFLYIRAGQRQPRGGGGHKNCKDSPKGRPCTCIVKCGGMGGLNQIQRRYLTDTTYVLLLFIKAAILCSLDLLLYSVC